MGDFVPGDDVVKTQLRRAVQQQRPHSPQLEDSLHQDRPQNERRGPTHEHAPHARGIEPRSREADNRWELPEEARNQSYRRRFESVPQHHGERDWGWIKDGNEYVP